MATLPEAELIDALVERLEAIADEDARLLAEGRPLPVGLGDTPLQRLSVVPGD